MPAADRYSMLDAGSFAGGASWHPHAGMAASNAGLSNVVAVNVQIWPDGWQGGTTFHGFGLIVSRCA